MSPALEAETKKVNRDLAWMLHQSSLSGEVPLRMTTRELDGGGSPDLSPELVRYIGAICMCGRPGVCAPGCKADPMVWTEHLPSCERGCPTENARFRKSNHKHSPTRMKRALRQVRRIDPKAHDALYLILALGYKWHDALAKINADNASRNKPGYTEAEFVVLTVAGGSLLAASY